jgi:hypothetical protein
MHTKLSPVSAKNKYRPAGAKESALLFLLPKCRSAGTLKPPRGDSLVAVRQ